MIWIKGQERFFKLIVDDFLKDGKPVGSRKLSIKMGEKLSPASVRNVMYDLQEAGLLNQITLLLEEFLRIWVEIFVDGLLQVKKISSSESYEIQNNINTNSVNLDQMCSEAGSLLSGLLDCVGIVLCKA